MQGEAAAGDVTGEEIAERMGGDASVLVEFGSGSSRKTSLLLSALSRVSVYVPIDVAGESLAEAAEWLSERHDGLAIRPLVADFTKTRTLPVVARRPRKLSNKEQRELDGIEGVITATEARKAELDTLLMDPAVWQGPNAKAPALQEELAKVTAEIERLYARWEELTAIG